MGGSGRNQTRCGVHPLWSFGSLFCRPRPNGPRWLGCWAAAPGAPCFAERPSVGRIWRHLAQLESPDSSQVPNIESAWKLRGAAAVPQSWGVGPSGPWFWRFFERRTTEPAWRCQLVSYTHVSQTVWTDLESTWEQLRELKCRGLSVRTCSVAQGRGRMHRE